MSTKYYQQSMAILAGPHIFKGLFRGFRPGFNAEVRTALLLELG